MAIKAPPHEAFFNHQVVKIFQVKKEMNAAKKTKRDLNFSGFLKTVCSTNNKGRKAINNNPIQPFGNQENANSKPVRIDKRYSWYFFN